MIEALPPQQPDRADLHRLLAFLFPRQRWRVMMIVLVWTMAERPEDPLPYFLSELDQVFYRRNQ